MNLDKVEYWSELSDYDLDTAQAMYDAGRWLYVGYMCHQTLEKIFKAFWCSRKDEPAPFSHNLINIAQSCGLAQMLSDEHKAFVSLVMPLNIEARYPSHKQALGESLSQERCSELIAKTREMQQWVKTKL